jgi:hypothetical protein
MSYTINSLPAFGHCTHYSKTRQNDNNYRFTNETHEKAGPFLTLPCSLTVA